MKKDFDISIIVCCYAGEETIEGCLNSLKCQKRDNVSIEVLLIDDGSKDKTAKKILKFLEGNSTIDNLQFSYFRKENEGLSVARNYGISKSKSSIVAFIDEDAVADEYFAMNIIKLFNGNTNVNCIGGVIELSNIDNFFANIIQNSVFSFQMKSEHGIIGTNMSFRKSLFAEVGGFQPEFTYRGDESAFFVKAKGTLEKLISKNVIVKHLQPPNFILWLKTRYENGYFSSAVLDLEKTKNIIRYKRLLFSLVTLFLPIITICCFIYSSIVILPISLLALYFLFILNRFFSAFNNYIKEYNRNAKGNILIASYIIVIVFVGHIVEDYGDLKGFLKYRNYSWKK